MVLHEHCTILAREEVGPDFHLLTLAAPRMGPAALPGQFLHVLTDPEGELLRRPFSIQDARRGASGAWEIELLYQELGLGTRLLSEFGVGESLDCLGPQGHPWPMPAEADRPVALVGGGVGVPPLVFLAKLLQEEGIPAVFFQGARRRELLLMTERIASYGAEQRVATDDGSAGHKGFVTDLLPPINQAPFQALYACGPLPMLQALGRWSGAIDGAAPPMPVYLSFENKMGCAMGACLGCVIPMRTGSYDRVCTEGPIFPVEAVDFARLSVL